MTTAVPAGRPLYDTGDAPRATRRLLLVSAAFPPHSIVGTARWEQFAIKLVETGWRVDVIMDEPGALGPVDWDRVRSLPPGIRAFTVARAEPVIHRAYLAAKRVAQRSRPATATATAGSDGATDASQTLHDGGAAPSIRERYRVWLSGVRAQQWVSASAKCAETITESVAVVVSSGPPHTAHVAAHRIAAARNIPHVVDLRDPWEGDSAAAGATGAHPLGPNSERAIVHDAALVIANTPQFAQVLRGRFPSVASRVDTIINGADLPVQSPVPRTATTPFRITHTGTLYLDRDPRPFFRATRMLIDRHRLTPQTCRVVFMGHPARVDGRSMEELLGESGLAEFADLLPFGTRSEAHAVMRDAAVLVAFQGSQPHQIPFKVFEYASFPAWLLALVGTDTATSSVLEGSTALVTEIDDVPAIEQALDTAYRSFMRGEVAVPVNADGRLSRQKQFELLSAHLDRLAPERTR
jgi:hypothetical protein